MTAVPRQSAAETVWLVIDATVALLAGGARRGSRVGIAVARAVRLLTDLTMRPPLVPQRYWPDRRLADLADSGRDRRRSAIAGARQLFRQLVLALGTEIIDQLDLTALIQERVDLDTLVSRIDVNAVVTTVDLDAIVARLDLIGLARYVVAAIDLPAIIREAASSLASDAVQGNRIQSIEADQAVAAWVDRVFGPRPEVQGDTGQGDTGEPDQSTG